MIFDLGGGTLDISLLTIEGPGLSVQAVAGDIHLHRYDFYDHLKRIFLKHFDESRSVTKESLDAYLLDFFARIIIGAYMGKAPFSGTDALEAVAKGATVFAGTLIKGSGIPDIREIVCDDICFLDLGTAVDGENMAVVIPRGARLPAIRSSSFVTTGNDQKGMAFEVYECLWKIVQKNRWLVSLRVKGLPPKVTVVFTVEDDGMLTVTASTVAGGSTTLLRVEKTDRLFTVARVWGTLQEHEAEQIVGAQEYDEARHRSEVEILVESFRVFLEQEPAI
jgi:molecular chaperone DnaK (HSP70)